MNQRAMAQIASHWRSLLDQGASPNDDTIQGHFNP